MADISDRKEAGAAVLSGRADIVGEHGGVLPLGFAFFRHPKPVPKTAPNTPKMAAQKPSSGGRLGSQKKSVFRIHGPSEFFSKAARGSMPEQDRR